MGGIFKPLLATVKCGCWARKGCSHCSKQSLLCKRPEANLSPATLMRYADEAAVGHHGSMEWDCLPCVIVEAGRAARPQKGVWTQEADWRGQLCLSPQQCLHLLTREHQAPIPPCYLHLGLYQACQHWTSSPVSSLTNASCSSCPESGQTYKAAPHFALGKAFGWIPIPTQLPFLANADYWGHPDLPPVRPLQPT